LAKNSIKINMIDYTNYLPITEEFPNGDIIRDFCKFSNLDIMEIHNKLINHRQINALDFVESDSPQDFYQNSTNYIYDLLANNWTKYQVSNKINLFLPDALRLIRDHSGEKFMEFGGGLGVFCQIVKEFTGKEVHYVDIDTYISKFAIWRFQDLGIDIKTKIIPQDDFVLDETYDIIFSDAVIEHLSGDQQIRYLNKLSRYLNSGGLMILIIDLAGHEEIMPMHYDVDILKIFEVLKSNGLTPIFNRDNFATIWKKD
jgi:2-polyprenyl-3-methyl-5-hydroxy-6-metoxy-1,4-benzoquinol methylase